MKFLTFITLSWVFLITNSCVNNRITFGKKYEFKESEQITNQERKSSLELTHSENEAITIQEKTEEEESSKSKLEIYVEDKIAENLNSEQTEKIIERIDASKMYSKPHSITKRSKLKNNGGTEKNPTTMFVLAVLFFGLTALFLYLAIEKLGENSNTYDGCATSILGAALFTVFAIITGIFGLVFLVLGIAFAVEKNR